MEALRVAVAQLPNRVGDLVGNTRRIAAAMQWAEHEAGADVLVLPELALTGYGLGDLVLHREFLDDADDALETLARRSGRTTAVVSTVERIPPRRSWDTRERHVAISAALLAGGEVRGTYRKVLLPIYDLFDEARNFAPGNQPDHVWRIGDVVCGVAICEDLWAPDGPPEAQSAAGARILLVPNSSPFHRGKAAGRLANTRAVAQRNGVPVVYVNFVGGQDEIAFDGGSIVVGADGELLHRGREFAEDRFVVDVPVAAERPVRGPVTNVHTRPTLRVRAEPASPPREALDDTTATWEALVTGLRAYVERNGFVGVALGLSGGVDSAVTAATAVDALGPERVRAVTMPSPETTEEETVDAQKVAANLGLHLEVVPVEAPSSDDVVPPEAARYETDASRYARERAYQRARAALLMDLFEERRHLVLATGNKTEISVGEAGLFGSLAGEFAPLKDCPKTLVYELARWRNQRGAVFPESLLEKASTIESFAPGQLPSYEVLDDIVHRYVEREQGLSEIIVDGGHDPEVVEDILHRIDNAELVRRYTPLGVKVTSRAFNQDRRMPLSNEWRAHRRPQRTEQPAAVAGEQGRGGTHAPEPPDFTPRA